MDILVSSSHVLLPIVYTFLLVSYAQVFARGEDGLARIARPLLVGTVAVHLASILLLSVKIRACPLGSGAEFLSLMAFSVTFIYWTIELRSRERALGVFAITPAFVLMILAVIGILSRGDGPTSRLGLEESIHAFAAIIGFAAVALASVFGLLYLFLYLAIKRGRFGLFYQKMPSLERLSNLNAEGLLMAFIALSVNVFVGAWEHWRTPDSSASLGEPVVIATLTVWIIYGVSLAARRWFQLGGKRLAALTLVGIPLLLAILVGELLTAGGFHG